MNLCVSVCVCVQVVQGTTATLPQDFWSATCLRSFPFSRVPINRLIVFKTFLLNAKYSQCAASRDADD